MKNDENKFFSVAKYCFKKLLHLALLALVFISGFKIGEFNSYQKISKTIAEYDIVYSGKNIEALILFKINDPISQLNAQIYSEANISVLDALLGADSKKQVPALKLMTAGLEAAIASIKTGEKDKEIPKNKPDIKNIIPL